MTTPIDLKKTAVLWPVIFLSWILPLFLFNSVESPTLSEALVYYYRYDNEFFYYGKGLFFSLFSVVLALHLLRRGFWPVIRNRVKSPQFVILGIMGLIVLVSTLFSQDIPLSLRGGLRHFEGIWVMLAYLLLPLLISVCVDPEEALRRSLRIISWSVVPVSTIGLLQYFGFNPINTTAFKALLFLNIDLAVQTPDIVHLSSGVSSTLGNSNFVGSYCAIMLPLTLGYYLLESSTYSAWYKAIPYLLTVNLLIASQSSGGIVGAFVGICILLFTPATKHVSNRMLMALLCTPILMAAWMSVIHPSIILNSSTYWSAGALTAAGWLFLLIVRHFLKNASPQRLFTRVHSLLLAGFIIVSGAVFLFVPHDVRKLDSIEAAANRLTFTKSQDTIQFAVNRGKLTVKAKDSYGERRFIPDVEPFQISTAEIDPVELTYVADGTEPGIYIKNYKTVFLLQGDRFMVKNMEKPATIHTVPKLDFLDGYESLGSSRIYIWSRTVPLLYNRLLWGSGPDTFAVNFPQNDALGRINNGLDSRLVVDKAHNMFLQYWVNYGFLFVLCFLLLLLMMGRDCSRVLISSTGSPEVFIIYSGIAGYCTTGLFNDSIPSVAPLFWMLIGLMCGYFHGRKRNISV